MSATAIQWTDYTVNPLRYGRGHFCRKISPGCANCYASRMQGRFGNPAFPGPSGPVPHTRTTADVYGAGPALEGIEGRLWVDRVKLCEVLMRKRPTRYFWLDMSDIFAEWWPEPWLDLCFATMALSRRHTHQVLTKRPARARDYLTGLGTRAGAARLESAARSLGYSLTFAGRTLFDWPLANVWLGVSVEDQARADERHPVLMASPAALHFWSAEPLLGPVVIPPGKRPGWVIIGGESGAHRPCHLGHLRALLAQCRDLGIPAFVKQLGACPVMDEAEWRAASPVPLLSARNHEHARAGTVALALADTRHGGDPEEWPADLRVREWPARRYG